MRPFVYHQPTRVLFGRGRLEQVGEIVAPYGRRCLLVTVPVNDVIGPLVQRVGTALAKSEVAWEHFAGVIANPTTDVVTAGSEMARAFSADVVLGVGGGSSMDTAKAIAVEAVHPGSSWDYLYFRDRQPTEKTLPIVAVSTTSGTGSPVTQVAVITNPAEKTKSAIYNPVVFPRSCIVDPELVLSAPPHLTASTGFDVFCHAFESYLHSNASPHTDMLALEAIQIVAKHLPAAVEDGSDVVVREKMAWADTLAGLAIANAGVTLPHGIGMTIGGQCPHVMHGEALAVVYPEFTRFTWEAATERFAAVGRIFNPKLGGKSDAFAAHACCDELDAFLRRIGMWLSFDSLDVSEADIVEIADKSRILPDYRNNPRIATREEIYEMLLRSRSR